MSHPGVIVIMYQLHGLNTSPRRRLIEAVIEARANDWFHYMRDSWLVKSYDPVDLWTRILQRHFGEEDALLVLAVDIHSSQGLLPEDAWEWMAQSHD